MKRVFLTSDQTNLDGRDPILVRRAAVALASYATNGTVGRNVGDLVHEEVTEGRRLAFEKAQKAGASWAQPPHTYSSCGDLVHWMLRCLGCRDERLVNRNDDGGDHPWMSGVNISRLDGSPFVICRYEGTDAHPLEGDAPFVMNQWGGHICVVESWDAAVGKAITHDYGQPYGKQKTKNVSRDSGGRLMLDGYPVMWWLDITRPPLAESASVPDEFELGVPDDNPYPEQGVPS